MGELGGFLEGLDDCLREAKKRVIGIWLRVAWISGVDSNTVYSASSHCLLGFMFDIVIIPAALPFTISFFGLF